MPRVKLVAFLLCVLALLFGTFATTQPLRASRIWGRHDLERLTPAQFANYLRTYRAFGIVLVTSGLLFAVDSLYH